MTHRGPFQPLLFCDSVILSWHGSRESFGILGRRRKGSTGRTLATQPRKASKHACSALRVVLQAERCSAPTRSKAAVTPWEQPSAAVPLARLWR